METKKKYFVKIPKNIILLYNKTKKIITAIGPLTTRSIKLDLDIEIEYQKKLIKIKDINNGKISNSKKKKTASLKGTTLANIKQLFLEVNYMLYKKLELVGVGYRAFDVENFQNKLLSLKLGYSHALYFKVPEKSSIFCLKRNKLFLYGNSTLTITQTAALIRSHKKPEPYKGKGILYENEKIVLKEGKKV